MFFCLFFFIFVRLVGNNDHYNQRVLHYVANLGMCLGIVDGEAECEDPDKTATLGAGWSGCALFAQICMSKSIVPLWYSYLVVKFLLSILLWFGVIHVARPRGVCVNKRRCEAGQGTCCLDTGFRHMSPVLARAIVWLIRVPCGWRYYKSVLYLLILT